MCGNGGNVLVVDDDEDCRELHALWVAEEYDVVTADGGTAAVERAGWADVLVVDRQMPDMGGETVACRVADDHDCLVVMVSGKDPGLDIVDLPVDAYLTKPVRRSALMDAVHAMFARADFEPCLREYVALTARRVTLERHTRRPVLADSDRYARLVDRLERKRTAIRQDIDGFDEAALEAALTVADAEQLGVLS